jgi:tol-pal system protein YbgF
MTAISQARFSLMVVALLIAFDASAAQWRATSPSKDEQGAQSNVSRETVLELLNQLEALQSEVRELRNQSELQENEIKQLRSRLQDVTEDLDRRVRTFERRGAAPAAPDSSTAAAAPAASPQDSAAPAAVPTTGKEQEDYEAAFQLMKQGDYTGASRSFRSFIQRYPSSPLTSNAQYWIAESNYFVRNFPLALKEFLKVQEQYPDSRKLPDAMLKIGYTYYELGEWAKARQYLEDVINRYPNSRNARSAGARLDVMKKEGH